MNRGTIRAPLVVPDTGDFLVDDTVTIEIGGRNKYSSPLRGRRNAWLAVDEIETGVSRRIPLWPARRDQTHHHTRRPGTAPAVAG